MTGVSGPSTGRDRFSGADGGGWALSSAWRTSRRWTWCSLARRRTDQPRSAWSRRIRSYSSTLRILLDSVRMFG